MSTVDSPTQGGSQEVDKTWAAARVALRPLDYIQYGQGGVQRVLGHYRTVVSITGAGLIAANAVLAAFRYTDPNSQAVIMRVSVDPDVMTAITAQRIDPLLMLKATGYTAAETTSATTIGLGSSGKMKSTMANCLAAIQIASAAAGMTGGTKTVDAQPLGAAPLSSLVAIGSGSPGPLDLYKYDALLAHPLVLLQNEGFLVQWGATALATGTLELALAIDWAEVPGAY
jgi:hypothetical protein